MSLKYYLRGLGIGIIVTAVIMGIAVGGKKEELSNQEIKERARELGMIEESTVLADAAANLQTELNKGKEDEEEPEAVPTMSPEPTAEPTPEATPTPSASIEPSATPSPIKTSEPSAAPTPEKTSEPTADPVPSAVSEPAAVPTEKPVQADEGGENSGTVTIQINSGDGSLTVSRKLEQAGLIASAADFDLYLCQNGYDKRINVGIFEIPANADQEQIAKILAGME
ncbi:MAG: hypothetical protein HDQ97_03950 [Lachnospiraceae bacterium]|nr:hypothetical protein [Lachnospiraceae bacterium]